MTKVIFRELAPGIFALIGLAVYLSARLFTLWREGSHTSIAWDVALGIGVLFWIPSMFIASWYMYAVSTIATVALTLSVVEMYFFQKHIAERHMQGVSLLAATRRAWHKRRPFMTQLQARLHAKGKGKGAKPPRASIHRKVVPMDEYRHRFSQDSSTIHDTAPKNIQEEDPDPPPNAA